MTLRFLVFGVLSLATMIPLLLFWAWPHSKALQNELDAVSDRNLQIAQSLAQSLGRYERDLRSVFALLAVNLIDGQAPAGGRDAMAALGLRRLCVVEPESGAALAGLEGGAGACPAGLSAERLALLQGLASSAEPQFSDVLADDGGEPVLLIALAHRDRLAYGELGTDRFVAYAEGIAFGERGHAAIVDRSGRLLAHPFEDWRRERRDISALPPVAALREGRSGTAVFYSPATEKEMVAGFAAVPGAGWGVMIPQPLAELHADAHAVQASALGVVAIGALAAGLVSWLLSGLLIRPLRAVAQAARDMAGGARCPAVGQVGPLAPREITDLRSAFNAMAEAVEASQREQEEARQVAEEAYLTRSRFLAHMSHEIRTPLNAIVGFSEVMLQNTYGPIGAPKYEEYLRDIHESAHHLLSLINDLLDLSRVDVDDLPFEETLVPIDEVMALSAALIRPRAREKAVTVSLGVAAPELRVRGDQRLLRRVLLHLLSNAVSFTPGGGWIVMRAEVLAGGELEIRVEDNGQGMTAEEREQALSAQRSTEPNDPWRMHSAGRGLTVVAKLVERHDGRFALDSEPGLGTTAIVTLPAQRIVVAHGRVAEDSARLLAANL